MLQKLHQNAKTNYAIRREIQSSSQSGHSYPVGTSLNPDLMKYKKMQF